MPTLTIKNLPPELYERLKERARLHRRSLNSEVIVCLEKAEGPGFGSEEEILVKARHWRERTASLPLSDDEITQAKREGRA
ncbi:MAG: Arc family DNA-binding protein [Acidobacteria bacterium]|nr:Arc family DNA-binding protein [Acidobacteriota bacterium]